MRTSAFLALMLLISACDPATEGDGSTTESQAINLADLAVKVEWPIPRTEECREPRPDNIGCTTLCKPCKTWICLDGEWVGQDISPPDFVCNGSTVGLGEDPFACPRVPVSALAGGGSTDLGPDFGDFDGGFCPAECSFCY